jgi:hypothetical protein
MHSKSLLEAILMEWLFGNWEFGRFRASCPGEFFLSASQGEVLREQSAELLMAHTGSIGSIRQEINVLCLRAAAATVQRKRKAARSHH